MSKDLSIIDLFAGAGGFGLGFQLAGYNPICSLEYDKWAADTLKENNGHKILNDDILNFRDKKEIFKAVDSKPSIIIGGPPCQGFSNAGKKRKEDPRNKMYVEYLNWVNIFKPTIFVIENVRGILTFKNSNGKNVIDDIIEKIESIGYQVSIWKLNAANYGVPQNRQRAFIVGHKTEKDILPPPITHSLVNDELYNPITVAQAISDLPKISAKEGFEIMDYQHDTTNDYQAYLKAKNTKLYNHVAMRHTPRVVNRYQKIIEGEKLEDMCDSLKVRKRNGNGELSEISFSLNYRYLKPDEASYTIPAHFYSSFIHPFIPRNITTREAARIQSFPDSYRFMGKRTMISSKLLKRLGKEELNHLSQYNQVGNAVPPILSKAIAMHLIKYM
jgi:DNA (cytosine-5)-methyltransferase 1